MIKQFSVSFLLLILFAHLGFSRSAVIRGAQADTIIPGAEIIRKNPHSELPLFLKFKAGKELKIENFKKWFNESLIKDNELTLDLLRTEQDRLGHRHYKYGLKYKGIPLEFIVIVAHVKNGRVYSFNGNGFIPGKLENIPLITVEQALKNALKHVDAERYKWEVPSEEKQLKVETDNVGASYYPHPKLVYAPRQGNFSDDPDFRLAYKINIYAHQPLYRADLFIDALTGKVIFENENIHTADQSGTAETGHSGNRDITADAHNGGFRLREAGRGNGIETYNMKEGTSYGSAVDFTDSDNYWDNANAELDEFATDAHWGAEMTYDYFYNTYNRNSIDGNGFALYSYVHYKEDYSNAFWDGQRITYGDGSGNIKPLTALDIAGHEITHGLTNFTANLIYLNEPGALNESFSDIFGAAVEFYAKPGSANWTLGEDIGFAIRSMSNPNAYNHPDTYQGAYWYKGTADNGGVHTNSGVQNHWFYLLANGGSGTNDHGNSYHVTGIGIDDAAAIAFRNLTVYLTSGSEYADARFYAIRSAIDLFGPCSPEVEATTNAWHAVGVGDAYKDSVIADFTADLTESCAPPFTVNFSNYSSNGISFNWDFGDGGAGTKANPSHTYSSYGSYPVSLIADGGSCGSDTLIKTGYIDIDSSNACVVKMPATGNGTQSSCAGTLYDDGGPQEDYSDNKDVALTIAPDGATSVTLDFISFNYEAGFDYLYIYDGPGTTDSLIGRYDGSSLPNEGTITSSGGSITLRHYSDMHVHEPGFELNWTCDIPNSAPDAAFTVNSNTSCSGKVSFTDQSLHSPTSWKWDFGDGNTSAQQNPVHQYTSEGTYTVTLIASNAYGSNSSTKKNIVTVEYLPEPAVKENFVCESGTVILEASGSSGGTLEWYNASSGGKLLGTGNTWTTPEIKTTTDYYVKEVTGLSSKDVGPPDNDFGAGGYFTGDQHLVFDCYKPFRLVSVWVDAKGSGSRTIELRNSKGVVLQDTSINIPDGPGRITLNFDITPGTGYQLGTGPSPDLYRNNAGTSFPYEIPGVVNIRTSSAGLDYYYFFYDWEILQEYCFSPMKKVTARVLDSLSISISARDTVCKEESFTMTSAPYNIDSVVWSPGGQTDTTIVVSLTTNTTFTVEGYSACGTVSDTFSVHVADHPVADYSYAAKGLTVNFNDNSTAGNTRLWDFGDGRTATSLNPSHTYGRNGLYPVMLLVTNGCGKDTIIKEIVVEEGSGVGFADMELVDKINIYPNPANSNFFIEIPTNTQQAYRFRLISLAGQTIFLKTYTFSPEQQRAEVPASKIATGVYVAEISNGAERAFKKLVIFR